MSQLVFLGGFPSGGTDLMKNVLNAHPEIYINGEMPFLYKLERYGIAPNYKITSREKFEFLFNIVQQYDIWSNLEALDELLFEELKDQSIKSFFEQAFSKTKPQIWGNKTPQNTENWLTLKKYFPSAKLLIVVRDIRDVTLSWKKKWGKNKLLTAHKWGQRMDVVCHDDIMFVKFEDLLDNPKKVTQEISEFLELNWNDRMLNHEQYQKKVLDGKINYGKSLNSANKEKWRHKLTNKEIKRIEEVAYNSLKRFSYPITSAVGEKKISKFEKLIGKMHDIWATLFVGNRFSDKNSFTERVRFVLDQIKYRFGS